MAFIRYNAHPNGNDIDDCVIRAVAKFYDISWEQAYLLVVMQGYSMKLFPTNRNDVWGTMLHERGCKFYYISDECPECKTVAEFANAHPKGNYILGTTTHAVAVVNGAYYDTWDSGDERPIYCFTK